MGAWVHNTNCVPCGGQYNNESDEFWDHVNSNELSDDGLYHPKPLLDAEIKRVKNWAFNRKQFFDKWKNYDLTDIPAETRSLLFGKADRALANSMTPDDLAAVMKESRGVDIRKEDGTSHNHLKNEWPESRRNILSVISYPIPKNMAPISLKYRLNQLQSWGKGNSREAQALKDKIGDLSNLVDHYESLFKNP